MGDVRGRHVAHLECEAEAGAPPPSLSTSLGARTPDAPGESILTSARLLKRETYRGRPLEDCEVPHKTLAGAVRHKVKGDRDGEFAHVRDACVQVVAKGV